MLFLCYDYIVISNQSQLGGRNARKTDEAKDVLKTLDHPTATEVYQSIHKNYPTISRATVFRVLSGFAQKGNALELRLAGSDVRYDYNIEPHFHVRCKTCERVADVFSPILSGLGKEVTASCGFTVEGCTVEFFGHCPRCLGGIS